MGDKYAWQCGTNDGASRLQYSLDAASWPADLQAPRLQGAELFLGTQVERAVAPETVKKRGEAFDEGYEQRH